MATLSTLREQIKSELQVNGTALDELVDNAIRSALRLMYGRRFWFLEARTTITLASGNSSVSLPSDYSASGTFSLVNGASVLQDGAGFDYLTFDNLERDYLLLATLPTGAPVACAVLNGTLYTSHTADQDYSVRVSYFKKDATLPTAGTDTSVWFDEGYDVIRANARLIFKREAQGYEANQADEDLAQYYYGNLCQAGAMYNEGAR